MPSPPDEEVVPPHVPVRRLTHAQYDRTVQDLLGLDVQPSAAFPPDVTAYGFINNAEAQTLSPSLIEGYDNAARDLLDVLFTPSDGTVRIDMASQDWSTGGPILLWTGDSVWAVTTNHPLTTQFELTTSGTHELSLVAMVTNGIGEPNSRNLQIAVDGEDLGTFDIQAPPEEPGMYGGTFWADPGLHELTLTFLDGAPFEPVTVPASMSVVSLDTVTITADDAQTRPAIWWSCDPEPGEVWTECATEILAEFVPRAWRRPLEPGELEGLLQLVETFHTDDQPFEEGIRAALHAVLLAPDFLFFIEPDTDSPTRPLTQHELATRLAYFIWGSTPDATLQSCADRGQLMSAPPEDASCDVHLQTRRLLDDAKSWAMVEDFASYWLQTRALDSVQLDPERYPDFDDQLMQAMRTETELLFDDFMHHPRDLHDLLSPGFGFVDSRLARHYGLPVSREPGAHRVRMEDPSRAFGILSQGSMLTLTSHSDRTSPTRRGVWVLEQLLCEEVPPPPNDVPLLEPGTDDPLEEAFDRHTSDPACASCHQIFDPIGFAFQGYGADGSWDPANQVTAMGDGTPVDSVADWASSIREDPAFERCVVEKLTTYALARAVVDVDTPVIDGLVADPGIEQGWAALVDAIVSSSAFSTHRSEEVP